MSDIVRPRPQGRWGEVGSGEIFIVRRRPGDGRMQRSGALGIGVGDRNGVLHATGDVASEGIA